MRTWSNLYSVTIDSWTHTSLKIPYIMHPPEAMMVWKMFFLFQGCISGSMLIFQGVYTIIIRNNTRPTHRVWVLAGVLQIATTTKGWTQSQKKKETSRLPVCWVKNCKLYSQRLRPMNLQVLVRWIKVVYKNGHIYTMGHLFQSLELEPWFLRLPRWTRCEKKDLMHCIELCFSRTWGAKGFNHKNVAANLFFALCTMAQWPNDLWANLCRVSSWNFVAFSRCFFSQKLSQPRIFLGGHRKIWSKGQKNRTLFCWLSFKKMAASFMTQNTCPLFFVCVCVFNTGAEKKKIWREGVVRQQSAGNFG